MAFTFYIVLKIAYKNVYSKGEHKCYTGRNFTLNLAINHHVKVVSFSDNDFSLTKNFHFLSLLYAKKL